MILIFGLKTLKKLDCCFKDDSKVFSNRIVCICIFVFVGRAVCKLGLLQRRCSNQKGYEKEIWL